MTRNDVRLKTEATKRSPLMDTSKKNDLEPLKIEEANEPFKSDMECQFETETISNTENININVDRLEEGHFEEEHVQQVYEAIAPHFSATRYKRWPIVEKFIKGIPKGSFGCDFGCGNGKNLENDPNGNIMTIGMDA